MNSADQNFADRAPVNLGPSPRQIQIGLRWNIVAGMLAMIWLILPGTPLTMLMECLGAEALLVGLLVSIQQFAMILQIPGALLSGLFRKRKLIWAVLAMVHRIVWFAPLLFLVSPRFTGVTGIRLLLVMITISSVFAQLSVSTWYAWMADLIPEPQRSRFWGTRQSMLWMVYTPAVVLFGYLLDIFPDPRQPGGHYFGFALVFTLGALAGCLDIVAHLKVPEPPPVLSAIRRGFWRRIATPFRNRDFGFLTAGMTIWYFNLGLIGSFSILYLTRKFGFNYAQLAFLNLSSSLAVIAGGFVWGFFIKRTGARSFLISILLIIPVFSFVWFLLRHTTWILPLPWSGALALPQPLLILLVSNFLSSLFYSGVGLCQLNMLSALTPREDRSMAMAVHWTAVGVGSSLGPLLGGLLVDWFEIRFPMPVHPAEFQFGFMHLLGILHAAATWGVALPLLSCLRTATGELPVGTTLSRLFLGNPLRLAGNILMMDTASTTRGRARAVRGVGRQRFELAVTDIIEQLQNPASAVREAAVAALGRIGNRDAVSAIVTQLSRPDTGLTLPLLRALRQTGDPAALPAVLPWLNHPHAEIVQAAARTLGAFRDRRAVGPLIETMQTSSNPVIVAACTEALEVIGDPAAMLPIALRIPDIPVPVLQRTLAMAVANLFSNRDTFYRLIENENRHPGTLPDTLIDNLSETIRFFPDATKRLAPAGERLLQSLRRRTATHDAAAAATVFKELTLSIGGFLYASPRLNDTSNPAQDMASQNEQFGILLAFIERMSTMTGTLPPPAAGQTVPPDTPGFPRQPKSEAFFEIMLPLSMFLLTTILKDEKRKF